MSIEPPQSFEDAVRQNLASLNEIVTELVDEISDDDDFVTMTMGVLRGHSWSLNMSYRGAPPYSGAPYIQEVEVKGDKL